MGSCQEFLNLSVAISLRLADFGNEFVDLGILEADHPFRLRSLGFMLLLFELLVAHLDVVIVLLNHPGHGEVQVLGFGFGTEELLFGRLTDDATVAFDHGFRLFFR